MEFKCQQLPYLGMDPKHRENIMKNTEKLINETDYKLLVRACREERLLNAAMINKIEAVHLPNFDKLDDEALQRERHRRLFMKLTKRGPDAYQKLKNILIRLGYHAAVLRLNEDDSDESHKSISSSLGRPIPPPIIPPIILAQPIINNTVPDGNSKSKVNDDDLPELRPYTEKISPKQFHEVIKSSKIHDDDKVGVYPMKTQHNRGVLLMVNIIEFIDKKNYRNGAKEDGESLLHLFKEFGFKLYAYYNLTHQQFFHILGALLQSEDVRHAECFVMALMSHGDMDPNEVERVQFTDGSVVKVRDILQKFNNESCLNLVKKPKIFLFPFCRGMDHDFGHKRTQTDGVGAVPTHIERIPSISDIIICYATFRGYSAHRDMTDGSWYIQCLCELMAKHAHNTHFEDIIKMIQNVTGKRRSETGAMQTGNYMNIGFNKKLFFNPGAYE